MTGPHTVLLTGASTGIGEAIVRRLDQLGYEVFATVRRPDDGARLAAGTSDRLHWLLLDVTDPGQIASMVETVSAAAGSRGLHGLVNNAGIGAGGPVELLSTASLRQVLEVNVVGLVSVTQAVLPLLRRARGRIVNIGSVSGRTVAPMVGAYSASKHAVEALTDALRIELRPAGIGVSVVEPGPVRTPIWDKGRRTLAELQGLHDAGDLDRYGAPLKVFERLLALNERRGIPVERVVRAVEHALRARVPRTRYLVGADARIRVLLRWLLPDRWNDALIRAVLRAAERRLT